MSVPEQIPVTTHTGNGVTTSFSYNFLVTLAADMAPSINGVPVSPSAFTVSGVGNPAGGSVNFTTPPAAGSLVALERVIALKRETDYQYVGPFIHSVVNDDFDRIWMALQGISPFARRVLRGQPDDVFPDLPPAGERALKLLSFDAAGRPVVTLPSSQSATALQLLLAGSSGANAVGFDNTTVGDILARNRTVDEYKLPGDVGDGPAVLRMAADTNGILRFGAREYSIGQTNLPPYADLRIIGAGMPTPDSSASRLLGGTVLIGGLNCRANRVFMSDFGLDNGSARALTGIVDGLICDALVGQSGPAIFMQNIAQLGPGTGTMHAILTEGYEMAVYQNIYVGRQYYGLVSKCRNGIVDKVNGDRIEVAVVFMRSSLPAGSGNVSSGLATNFKITNVDHRAATSNTTAAAVRIEADTVSVGRAQVVNVATLNGRCGLLLKGGGSNVDPLVAGITYTNIRGDDSQYIVVKEGYNYDCIGSNLQGANLKTGRAAIMPAQSFAWLINGVQVAITDASITSDVCLEVYGTGAWDNVVVRNAFRKMKVQQSWGDLGNIRSGTLGGDAVHSLDQALNLVNGATAAASPNEPMLRILPGSFVQLTGRVNIGSNKSFALLPATTGGRQRVYPIGAVNGGSYVARVLRLNDFDLTVEPSLTAGDVLDLSTVGFAF